MSEVVTAAARRVTPLSPGEGGAAARSAAPGEGRAIARIVADYLELSKSRIVLMVLITTAGGYLLGAAHFDLMLMVNTLIGTALVAAGTNALNQYVEREHDGKMRRTSRRPLPDGRMTPRAALIFSTAVAIIGTAYLVVMVNTLTAVLGAFTLTSYIFVYTPLKRISTACTIIGAVPGAIPPLMGWTAATGHLSAGGWVLFGILFFWQLPHFMAISWIYREDYGRAGYVMTAVSDSDGTATARQAILYSLALLAVSVMPSFIGMAGLGYLIGSTICGVALLAMSIRFFFDRSNKTAMKLFMTSNLYLVAMMAMLGFAAR
jgi:protoheme IX farnesyltransferase